MDRNVKAAITLLENQFIAPLNHNVKPVEETIVEPVAIVAESQEVIEEEEGYIPEDTDIVMEGFLFEEGTHVGEHVGFRYRSAHPEGRIAKIVRNVMGKIKKVFIRPDKKDRHPGEGAEVSRVAGKFHAITEAKGNLVDDHLTANQHQRMYNYHMNAANDTFEDGGSEDPDFDAIDHYKAADHHAKKYHELSGHKLYDPSNMKPTEHITSKISEAKDEDMDDAGALKYVKKMNGKWALYSIHSGKALKYFDEKPTKEEADKALRNVEFYKNKK